MASKINAEHSGLYPGKFKDKGTFEAVVSKKHYYNNDLDFAVAMYISLQKCHVFHDGNKRTSLGLLEYMLEKIDYSILSYLDLVDYQILFIENEICEKQFKEYIHVCVSNSN